MSLIAGIIGFQAAVPATPAAATGAQLTWAPPPLDNVTTITVTPANQNLVLDDNKDYRLVVPGALTSAGGLVISGGHDVVLIGGDIRVPNGATGTNARRGLYLKNQTGTVHIEGLHIGGDELTEGIDMDQRKGATVQLQNISVDTVHGTQATNHADVIQSWAGPHILRIDRLTASTTYQGMFLLPHQFTDAAVGQWDFRNVDIAGTPESGYMLWKEDNHIVATNNVFMHKTDGATNKLFWPNAAAWPGVLGIVPTVAAAVSGIPGLGYVSPGYVGVSAPTTSTTTTTTVPSVPTTTTTTTTVPTPVVTTPAPSTGSPNSTGYWLVAKDGGIFSFGEARFFGSTGGMRLNQPVVGMTATKSGNGYWLVAEDGGIFSFGDASFKGSTGGMPLNKPVVGMTTTKSGNGYWLVASDGGIFSYGDATFQGSTGGMVLNKPITAMAATPSGRGYWLVAADGGVFCFGDAAFYGSGAGAARGRVAAIEPTASGRGYWIFSEGGWVGAYGDAENAGSVSGLSEPVVGASSR